MTQHTLSPEVVEAVAKAIAIENVQRDDAEVSHLHRRIAQAALLAAYPLLEREISEKVLREVFGLVSDDGYFEETFFREVIADYASEHGITLSQGETE